MPRWPRGRADVVRIDLHLPRHLHELYRERAHAHDRSLNKELVAALRWAAALDAGAAEGGGRDVNASPAPSPD